MRSDRDWSDVLGKDEVKYRQIVWSEIPENVYIWLHEAEIDADRINELDLANLPAPDELADSLHCRGVAVRVIAHEHQAGPAGERGQLLSLSHRGRQRFLHQ